jgi:CelD/BcsL family acetyltransferase involved in cellulose biosynthesis
LNSGLPENDEFRQELRELSLLDSMRGYLLYHEAKPIAYLYCPIQDDILLYRYLGYDPEFKQWSPGTVLQHIVLEKLFAEGRFRMFDFTEGQGPHKEFFATGNTRCADLYFFRPTLRNLLLLKLHSGLNSFSAKTVKTLDRIGLKSKIKKLIRAKG